jgi:hypothetical protein
MDGRPVGVGKACAVRLTARQRGRWNRWWRRAAGQRPPVRPGRGSGLAVGAGPVVEPGAGTVGYGDTVGRGAVAPPVSITSEQE